MTEEEKGKFIVIDGQGFSGKTTQSKLLSSRLSGIGIDHIQTFHPGGIPETVALREEVLRRKKEEPDFTLLEEFGFFHRALDILYHKLIVPETANGKWIVLDRYWASPEVYQGGDGGLDKEMIREIAGSYELQPDLSIFLSVSPETIIDRTVNSGRALHAYNQQDLETIDRRHRNYTEIAERNTYGSWVIVDGNSQPALVHREVWKQVKSLMSADLVSSS